MSDLICFPQERNVGRAKHVASLYLRKATEKERRSYRRVTCNRFAGVMARVGFCDAEIDRQLQAFRAAVEHEIDTINAYTNQQHGPGAA